MAKCLSEDGNETATPGVDLCSTCIRELYGDEVADALLATIGADMLRSKENRG